MIRRFPKNIGIKPGVCWEINREYPQKFSPMGPPIFLTLGKKLIGPISLILLHAKPEPSKPDSYIAKCFSNLRQMLKD